MFYPQSNFYPQIFNPLGFNSPASAGQIPFANTLYGFPPPLFTQGQSQYPNWQQAQQQLAALQQQALQQLLAPPPATQPFGAQTLSGAGAMSGFSNGSNGAAGPGMQQWQLQQPSHHLLQQLAQYHQLIAQQLAQLAAQQAFPTGGGAYGAQFIPGQLGQLGQLGSNYQNYQPAPNYQPGSAMH